MTNADYNFLKEVKDIPLLTAEREKELGTIVQARKGGKQKNGAIAELVEHNLKLVVKEAYKYSKISSVPVDELYNAGRIGLIKASYGYDPVEFDTRFSTYAIPWIQQGIREAIHCDSPVKVPLHIVNGKYRKGKAIEENGEMTDKELMKALGVTEAQLDKIHKASVTSISLNMPVRAGEAQDTPTTIGDLMPDENATLPGDNGIEDNRFEYLDDAMDELDDLSKEIIKCQILEDDKTKLSDLGKRFGMSGERVRQIKDKALMALKKKIEYRMSLNGELDADSVKPSKTQKPKKQKIEKKEEVAEEAPKMVANLDSKWRRGKSGCVTIHACYRDGRILADIRTNGKVKTVRLLKGRSVIKSWDGSDQKVRNLKDIVCSMV